MNSLYGFGSDGFWHDVIVVEGTALVGHVGCVHCDVVEGLVAAEFGSGGPLEVLGQLLVDEAAVLLGAALLAHGGDDGTVVADLLASPAADHHDGLADHD